MTRPLSCVDASRLRELLHLAADSPERLKLETHLQECDHCRKTLVTITSEALRSSRSVNAPDAGKMTAEHFSTNTISKPEETQTLSRSNTGLNKLELDSPGDLELPRRLAHYELIEVIGRGGMGTVYKARDEKLHRTVALKTMSPELATSETARHRFIREARAAAAVTHEHIITIHAVDDSRRIPFLVMQFVEGRSLQDRMADGPFDVEEIIRISRQIASGLAAAHAKGLVHRDIKPGNILLETPDARVKITDFGLARAVDDASLSQSGSVIGTPLYMSPEQAQGEALDHRADLFSLGSVMYALCTGSSPFRAGNTLAVLKRVCEDQPQPIRSFNTQIPAWFESIIHTLLAKHPAQRFQSANQVVDALSSRLVIVPQISPALDETTALAATRIIRQPGTHRRLVFGAAVVLIALGALIAFSVRQRDKDRPEAPTKTYAKTSLKDDPSDSPNIVVNLPNFQDVMPKNIPFPFDPAAMFKQMGELQKKNPVFENPFLKFPLFDPKPGELRYRPPLVKGGPGPMASESRNKLLAVPFGDRIALLKGDTGASVLTIEVESGRIRCVALSPDGENLLGGSDAKTNNLFIWNTHSGKLERTLEGHTGGVNSVAFSADNQQCVTGADDCTVRIWNLRSNKNGLSLDNHGDIVRCAVFDRAGKRVFASGDSGVRVWNSSDGKPIQTLAGHTAPVRSIAFNENGTILATGSDAELKVWNAVTLEEITSKKTGAGWLAFSPDRLTLYTAAEDHSDGSVHIVTLWNALTWKNRSSYELISKGGFAVYHLSADGSLLFANRFFPAPDVSAIIPYDAATGRVLLERGEISP